MKLTKLQRYTAYVIMLEEYKTNKWRCLCSLWNYLLEDDSWEGLYKILPELFSKSTRIFDYIRIAPQNYFWFFGYKDRIAALKACIEETHP